MKFGVLAKMTGQEGDIIVPLDTFSRVWGEHLLFKLPPEAFIRACVNPRRRVGVSGHWLWTNGFVDEEDQIDVLF